jgi:copper chaperone CopZ
MKVDGVTDARADHTKGSAWAKYDPSKTTPVKLVEVVNKTTPYHASLKSPQSKPHDAP